MKTPNYTKVRMESIGFSSEAKTGTKKDGYGKMNSVGLLIQPHELEPDFILSN
jgi:hypothetical protein